MSRRGPHISAYGYVTNKSCYVSCELNMITHLVPGPGVRTTNQPTNQPTNQTVSEQTLLLIPWVPGASEWERTSMTGSQQTMGYGYRDSRWNFHK